MLPEKQQIFKNFIPKYLQEYNNQIHGYFHFYKLFINYQDYFYKFNIILCEKVMDHSILTGYSYKFSRST